MCGARQTSRDCLIVYARLNRSSISLSLLNDGSQHQSVNDMPFAKRPYVQQADVSVKGCKCGWKRKWAKEKAIRQIETFRTGLIYLAFADNFYSSSYSHYWMSNLHKSLARYHKSNVHHNRWLSSLVSTAMHTHTVFAGILSDPS